MNTETLDRLEALLAKADILPLEYATGVYDDWGQIRCGPVRASGLRAALCSVRFPYADEEAKAGHRKAGMDPYETSARLLVEAMNALPALLSIARRAADVEGMVAALYKDWPFRAISTALVEATGVALNETIPLQTFLDAGGDVNGLRKHATAVSRYVMGETT